jgi:hypothetical protein
MMSVIKILEDPIVAVRDAPILRRPVEYDKEPINGINENRNNMVIVTIDDLGGCSNNGNASFEDNTE